MKTLTAKYLPGIENISEEEIFNELHLVDRHEIDCVNWKEYPYAPEVGFHLAFSDKVLAVLFEVNENHVKAVTLENNGPVWEDSCVEFFIGNPTGKGYFNFEMNCIGAVLAAKRKSKTDAQHFGPETMSQIRNFGSLKHEAIDCQQDGQSWWRVELIPFSVLGLEEAPASLRGNFYKCGDNCAQTHFLSWSEIKLPQPNFHCPDYFGEIQLTR